MDETNPELGSNQDAFGEPIVTGGPSVGQDAPPAQPAGWYPAPGGQRYWDGKQWTEHTAPAPVPATGYAVAPLGAAEERQFAMFAHLGQLLGLVTGIGGFVVPLILMLTKGKESDFVRRAAVESLNFWITGIIAGIVAFVLLFVLIGIVLLPLVGIIWLALPIYAGIKANEGIDYRYPFNLRLIS